MSLEINSWTFSFQKTAGGIDDPGGGGDAGELGSFGNRLSLSAVLWITNFPAFPDSKKFQLIGLETHVSTAFNRWYRRYSTDSGSMVPTIFDEFRIG